MRYLAPILILVFALCAGCVVSEGDSPDSAAVRAYEAQTLQERVAQAYEAWAVIADAQVWSSEAWARAHEAQAQRHEAEAAVGEKDFDYVEAASEAREKASEARESVSRSRENPSLYRIIVDEAEENMMKAQANATGPYAALWERAAEAAGRERAAWEAAWEWDAKAGEAYEQLAEAWERVAALE